MERVKSRLFKKYLQKNNNNKNKKSRVRFRLSLGWLNVSKKIIENYNSVGAGAHKVEKVVSPWPSFDPNFPDICKV